MQHVPQPYADNDNIRLLTSKSPAVYKTFVPVLLLACNSQHSAFVACCTPAYTADTLQLKQPQ